jgi:diguanylate cyclase (GGDEF)-like protein
MRILPLSRVSQAVLAAVGPYRPAVRVAVLALVLPGAALAAAALGWLNGSWGLMAAVGLAGAVATAVAVQLLVLRPLEREYRQRLEAQARRYRSSALTDAVTGVLSRRAITSSLLEAMAQSERYRHPLSVALVRIERLRDLNARLGRRGTERVLQRVAGVFFETLRMPDRVGRYNEEEFLIVLPHTAPKDADGIVARIQANIADADLGNAQGEVGLSAGATRFRRGEDLEQMIARLMRALPPVADRPG